MLRLSMNEVTTYRWSFEEDIFEYEKAGYQAIGVWRRKLADFGEEKGIELLCECGLPVSNLFWAGGFTGSDGRGFDESVADAKQAIRLASAMQAGCLVVWTGGRNHHIAPQVQRLLFGAIDALLPFAEMLGVTLALEPMHVSYAEEWTVLTSLEQAAETIDVVDSPFLKLAIDTYHIGHDANAMAALPYLADRVAIVHLADSRAVPTEEQNRCRLGEGNVPLRQIATSLIQAGYRGDFDIELLGEEIEGSCYLELLDHSRAVASQLISSDAGLPTNCVAGRGETIEPVLPTG
ncbi:MAG: sugar phosphate isomerase/epimerase [Pirellulales bacterium]|nr:sugar phosphate isomerase/epimerase [Pirellulales bacterium]